MFVIPRISKAIVEQMQHMVHNFTSSLELKDQNNSFQHPKILRTVCTLQKPIFLNFVEIMNNNEVTNEATGLFVQYPSRIIRIIIIDDFIAHLFAGLDSTKQFHEIFPFPLLLAYPLAYPTLAYPSVPSCVP